MAKRYGEQVEQPDGTTVRLCFVCTDERRAVWVRADLLDLHDRWHDGQALLML